MDPFDDEQLAVALFFVSLFLLTSSLTSLVGYFIRVVFYRSELFLNHFNVSLRQGILIALGITGLFGLQVLQTLGWWNGLMVICICVFTELYFVAKE
ncbi:MAG: hypothetical protein P1V18_02010 [Candidatus Gracilibacteria bacterium]|nr:hypothetical protein [Candidatus Gracilibacteria bacterium]